MQNICLRPALGGIKIGTNAYASDLDAGNFEANTVYATGSADESLHLPGLAYCITFVFTATQHKMQLAYGFGADQGKHWYRTMVNGNWGRWYLIQGT